jgi:hypothetical protein
MTYKKKLIEVALPLEDINREATRGRTPSAWAIRPAIAQVVGTTAVGGVSGRAVCVAGG